VRALILFDSCWKPHRSGKSTVRVGGLPALRPRDAVHGLGVVNRRSRGQTDEEDDSSGSVSGGQPVPAIKSLQSRFASPCRETAQTAIPMHIIDTSWEVLIAQLRRSQPAVAYNTGEPFVARQRLLVFGEDAMSSSRRPCGACRMKTPVIPHCSHFGAFCWSFAIRRSTVASAEDPETDILWIGTGIVKFPSSSDYNKSPHTVGSSCWITNNFTIESSTAPLRSGAV
jgi:hypothetical protein